MTKSRKPDYSKIDIHKLLEQRHQVAVIWGTEDIRDVRPDLNDDQAWEVLKECSRRHDCNDGFTWQFIDLIANGLFPRPYDDETSDEEEGD